MVTDFYGYNALCPACYGPSYANAPHSCTGYFPNPEDRRGMPLSDTDIDRIAKRVAEILQTSKRSTEQ